MFGEDKAYDRITQILQSQSTPQNEPLGAIQSANAFISSLNGGDYTDISNERRQQNYTNARQVQQDTVSREMDLLKVFEAKRRAGDAQAKALDEKIRLFTGDDPEGMAIFLKGLHEDPEEIDAGNSYQVMTKLAKIAKQSGYKSRELKQKETMDAVNKQIMGRLSGSGGEKLPLNARNNNPINMRGGDGEFQAFKTPQEGIEKAQRDLLLKINGKSPIMTERYGKGYQPTLQSVLETLAPPTENDTQNYVNFVSQRTGIAPDAVLSPMDIQKLIPAMIEMEGGKEASQYYGGQDQVVGGNGQDQIADSGQIMNDGMDEITQMQVLSALASGDTNAALKAMADARKTAEPASPQGKLEQDYRKGLVSKETFEKASKSENLELETRNEGKKNFEGVLKDMNTLLDELDKEGGIVNTNKNSIMNTGRYLANTEGGSALFGLIPVPGGQDVGRAFGTKEQTIRDKLDAKKKLLSRVIMQATGMSAKQMDSNTELKMFLNSLGNPSSSYQSNKDILKTLSGMYGLGTLAEGSESPASDLSTMSDDEILQQLR